MLATSRIQRIKSSGLRTYQLGFELIALNNISPISPAPAPSNRHSTQFSQVFPFDSHISDIIQYFSFTYFLCQKNILKKSLPHPVIQRVSPQKLIQGFEFAGQNGASPAMIKARLVRTLGGWGADDAANFFVGALLHDDIRVTASLCSPSIPLVLGGSEPLRTVFGVLLRNCGIENIIDVPTEVASIAPNIGAITVYEKFIQNKNGISAPDEKRNTG